MCIKSDYCVCLITLVSDRNNKYEGFNYGTVVLSLSIQSTSSQPSTIGKKGKESQGKPMKQQSKMSMVHYISSYINPIRYFSVRR